MSSINPSSGAGASSSGSGGVQAFADDARHKIEEGASAALDKAQDAAGELKDEAGKIAGQAMESARSFAEDKKGKIAGQVDSLASALTKAADDLESGEQPQLAGYARQIAGGVNQVSSALRDKGVDELLGMVGGFARTNTAAFVGAAALLGFAASRFAMAGVKTAAGSAGGSEAYPDYGSDNAGMGQPLSGEPVVSEPWDIGQASARKPAGTADSSGGSI
jgi:hypothetical protein